MFKPHLLDVQKIRDFLVRGKYEEILATANTADRRSRKQLVWKGTQTFQVQRWSHRNPKVEQVLYEGPDLEQAIQMYNECG